MTNYFAYLVPYAAKMLIRPECTLENAAHSVATMTLQLLGKYLSVL